MVPEDCKSVIFSMWKSLQDDDLVSSTINGKKREKR